MNESSQDVETVKYMAELEDVNEQAIPVSNVNSHVFLRQDGLPLPSNGIRQTRI